MTRLSAAMLIAAAMQPPCAAAAMSDAGTWPARPIRFIVLFSPGSATDTIGRVIGQKVGELVGQQIVIDNRAGASGSIGAEMAARATPDGYTLVLGTASTHAVAASVNARLAYDPVRDFAPISLIGSSPYVVAAHPALAAGNLKEFIALARAKPAQLSYASAGNASLAHLAGELFSTMAGVKLNHVPYKSSALSVLDVLSGRIELQFGTVAPTLPHIRAGKLRALAVTGATRLAAMPDVPTVAESGLRGYDVSLWMGILAPHGTPGPIVTRLNREILAALETAAIREALVMQGVEPRPSTPAAFAAYIRDEIAKYRKVAKAAGIKTE